MKAKYSWALVFVTAALLAALPAFAADQDRTSAAGTSQQGASSMDYGTAPGTSGSWSHQGSSSTPTHRSSSMKSTARDKDPSMSGHFQAFHAKDLLGKGVKNRHGDDLGKVEDIVFGKDGSADFVVLSRGGTLGAGTKYYPVPFNTFMSNTTNMARLHTDREIIANLEKSKLDSAPSFSDKKWDVSNMESHDKICAYYGAGACNRTM